MRHPTAYYGEAANNAANHSIIAQQRLISNMLGLCIKNSLPVDDKRKLRAFKSSYSLNTQDNGAVTFFVIFKMVRPDTPAVCSDIKSNLESVNMSQFEHNISKANLQIAEWMNEISISGETYSKIVRQKFNPYSTSSCPLFKDYMNTRKSEWD